MPKEQANIYRQRAAECEALARHYENTPLAKYFLELAEQWRQLADQTVANDLSRELRGCSGCLVIKDEKARSSVGAAPLGHVVAVGRSVRSMPLSPLKRSTATAGAHDQ